MRGCFAIVACGRVGVMSRNLVALSRVAGESKSQVENAKILGENAMSRAGNAVSLYAMMSQFAVSQFAVSQFAVSQFAGMERENIAVLDADVVSADENSGREVAARNSGREVAADSRSRDFVGGCAMSESLKKVLI